MASKRRHYFQCLLLCTVRTITRIKSRQIKDFLIFMCVNIKKTMVPMATFMKESRSNFVASQ